MIQGRPDSPTCFGDGRSFVVCGTTIQACINNPIVVSGDRILIPAGIYTESLTLNKAVSLMGANADTTIVHAVSGQRVMTVTGSAIRWAYM